MTKKQYRKALKDLGLTQVAAAKLFGINPRTSRKYALGESPIPHTLELLIRYLIAEQGSM